jgi:hypothetical protein
MKPFVPAVVRALSALPEGKSIAVFLASDDTVSLAGEAARLSQQRFEGGMDNVPALQRALAAADAVVWIHGSQPFLFQRPDALRQAWERRPGHPPLYSLQVTDGPNKVLAELDGLPEVRTAGRLGLLEEDLRELLGSLTGSAGAQHVVRERVPWRGEAPPEWGTRASDHLARLWAFDEIQRLSLAAGPKSRERAVDLARSYQLVTPMSGAVVLENQQQYKQAGLRPADAWKVPTIPEPSTFLLLGVAAAAMAVIYLRKRRACAGC